MEVAPEKVEALTPTPEVDHSGLLRMEQEPEFTEEGGRPPLGFLGLALRGAQHHEVIRVADDFSLSNGTTRDTHGVSARPSRRT